MPDIHISTASQSFIEELNDRDKRTGPKFSSNTKATDLKKEIVASHSDRHILKNIEDPFRKKIVKRGNDYSLISDLSSTGSIKCDTPKCFQAMQGYAFKERDKIMEKLPPGEPLPPEPGLYNPPPPKKKVSK